MTRRKDADTRIDEPVEQVFKYDLKDPKQARKFLRDARWPNGSPLEHIMIRQEDGSFVASSILQKGDAEVCFIAEELCRNNHENLTIIPAELH